jgi:hypothetical protein
VTKTEVPCHVISADLMVTSELVKFLQFYRGADKSLARPGREKATATKDFDFHISYLYS